MASLGHVAVGVAAARFAQGRLGQRAPGLVPSMLLFAGLSLLPDADVISFSFGIPYEAPFGHRGASHSFVFAALVGVAMALVARAQGWSALRTGLLAGLVTATHGPLDALTDGGRGIALLWPFSTARYFFPWQPIPVAPIGIHFLSADGMECARTELLYFLPLWAYAFWPRKTKNPAQETVR